MRGLSPLVCRCGVYPRLCVDAGFNLRLDVPYCLQCHSCSQLHSCTRGYPRLEARQWPGGFRNQMTPIPVTMWMNAPSFYLEDMHREKTKISVGSWKCDIKGLGKEMCYGKP
jgi:hypothetical protein